MRRRLSLPAGERSFVFAVVAGVVVADLALVGAIYWIWG
jgi:hypothetical protein